MQFVQFSVRYKLKNEEKVGRESSVGPPVSSNELNVRFRKLQPAYIKGVSKKERRGKVLELLVSTKRKNI